MKVFNPVKLKYTFILDFIRCLILEVNFFPYDSFRPGQRETLRTCDELLRTSKVLILKAPTGFGKTSVAITLGVSRAPAIHSVRTRNEITPVLRDLTLLRRKLSDLKFSFIHSAHNMCPLIRTGGVEAEDFWINCHFLRDLGRCEYFEISKSVVLSDVESIICSSNNHVDVVRSIVRILKACPYFTLVRLALQSDYVVVTYPYVFTKELFESLFQERGMADYSLIVDEAHMFVDPATIYSYEVSESKIRVAADEVVRYLGGDDRVEGLLNRLLEVASSKSLASGLCLIRGEELGLNDELVEYVIIKALEVKRAVLNELLRSGASLSSVVNSRVAMVKVATLLSRLTDSRFKLFTYRYGDEHYFVTTAVDHEVIKEVLNSYKLVIMMSGTPPPKEFVERVLRLEGVTYVDALELGAKSPYDNIALLLTTQLTSKFEARDESMYELYSQYIRVVDKFIKGVKLVVYPSYEFMNNVIKYLGKGFTERRDTTIEDLMKSLSSNMLIHAVAGGKLCEGVEVTRAGRSLISCVFVAGVPYPQGDDYLKEVLRHLILKVSLSEAKDYVYNLNASIKTLQAIGRSIRSEGDSALVVLGDRRFLYRSLRKYLTLRMFKFVRNLKEFEFYVERLAEELML
ncbi:MAG: ATP-dependent DNA helicase [Sulfolobales archaeon]